VIVGVCVCEAVTPALAPSASVVRVREAVILAVGVFVGVAVSVRVGVGVRKSPPRFWESARCKARVNMNRARRMRRMIFVFMGFSLTRPSVPLSR
jgi:hypothetical protein